MNPYQFTVSFRVTHPALDAKGICDSLGMAPSRSWSVGERRRTPKGGELEEFYKQTYCCFELGAGIQSSTQSHLDDFLREVNKRVRTKSEFLEQLVRSGGTAEYFVGLFGDKNFGLVLEPDLLCELSELAIALSMDIYPGPPEQHSESAE